MLNFGDRTRTGAFNVVWPLATDSEKIIKLYTLTENTRGVKTVKTITGFLSETDNELIKNKNKKNTQKERDLQDVKSADCNWKLINLYLKMCCADHSEETEVEQPDIDGKER